MDKLLGVNWMGVSATLVQFISVRNWSTSSGKFLGNMVRTSPGTYCTGDLTARTRCRTSCQCVGGVTLIFWTNVAIVEPPMGSRSFGGSLADASRLSSVVGTRVHALARSCEVAAPSIELEHSSWGPANAKSHFGLRSVSSEMGQTCSGR